MGGKSGSKGSVSSSGMPEWARTAHTDLMARANTESKGTFSPYTGERVADESKNTIAGRNNINGLAGGNATFKQGVSGLKALQPGTNDRMDDAYSKFSGMSSGTNSLMDEGTSGYRGLTSGTNGEINAGIGTTAGAIGAAANLNNYDQGEYASFGTDAANKYMSPYQQGVTDIAKREAIGDYQRANIMRNSDLVSRGAFGGSRQAIIQSEADKALGTQLTDMQTKGLQDSWLNAQQQFGADRTANAAAFDANSEVDRARMDAYMTGGKQLSDIGQSIYDNQMGASGKLFDAGNTQFSNANTAAENMADMGTEQFKNQAGIASDLVGAGDTQFKNDFEVGKETYKMGKDQEMLDQAQINADYGDYLTDRDWSKNQMGWYSGIMTGAAPGYSTYTGESANGNPAANLMGLGTAAIGAIGNANT